MALQWHSTGTTATDVIDLNDAATTIAYTFDAPKAGKINLRLSYARVTEAIGTMTTTVGVGSVEVGGVEYATIVPTASDAVGTTYTMTEAAAVGDDGAVYVAAGDKIDFVTKTQAVGGTVTGELEVFLACEWDNS